MIGALLRLAVSEARGRIAFVALVGMAFLLGAALTAGAAGGEHAEMDEVFRLGGYPLVSAVLLMGWTVGRFPLLAAIALFAGFAWGGSASGRARTMRTRPVSEGLVFGSRAVVFALAAFLLSALVLPAFDLLLLRTWAGPATLVLAAGHVLAYGSLTALLSVWTRADAAIAAVLAILAHVWHAALRSGAADAVPFPVGRLFSFLLPPQGALFALENAFAGIEPIPWDSFAYVAGYAALLAGLTGVSLLVREI